jgi:hypothetical protein
MSLRTVRGVVVTALIWGAVWTAVGALIGVLEFFSWSPTSFRVVDVIMRATGPMTVLGIAGLSAGATFAIVLSRAERGGSIDAMPIRRAAKWGAVAGLTFALAGLMVVALAFGVQDVMMTMSLVWTAVAAVCGAASAAGSLAIAQKGEPGLLEEAAAMQRVAGR